MELGKENTKVAIVVPCYNEEEVLETTIPRLVSLVDNLIANHDCSPQSFIVFVDDGSNDDTWELISTAAIELFPGRVHGLRLACNAGHQGALLSGLEYVTGHCDAAISIDADLQHDLAAIPRMIEEFRKGYEIVLGVRISRDVDSWFKRSTAQIFYKIMRWMGVNLVENHADFRLMSGAALNNMRQFSEVNLFLRGFPPLLHKKISTVSHQVTERMAGESKYPLRKMLALAWNGITSFSVVPLRLISITGGIVLCLSLFMAAYALFGVVTGKALPGWASIVIPLYLLGGILMLSIGIVGEYVGKVFLETKRRPRFLVDTVVGEPIKDD